MPKFIGRRIDGAVRIEDNAEPAGAARVRLSYAQASLLPAESVMYGLDTTDRGSKGTYAKRWYRWFASADAILACAESTARMRDAAERALVASGRARLGSEAQIAIECGVFAIASLGQAA